MPRRYNATEALSSGRREDRFGFAYDPGSRRQGPSAAAGKGREKSEFRINPLASSPGKSYLL